jgi:hypothetical protein
MVSLRRRCAVSRSEAISRHRSIGTITPVGFPSSSEMYWISVRVISASEARIEIIIPEGAYPVFTHARSTSATLQAWAMQPRGK